MNKNTEMHLLLSALGNYTQDAKKQYKKENLKHILSKIVKALLKKKKILIFGDKDADGIFSSIIMKAYLQRVGLILSTDDNKPIKIDIVYSDRELDGFGLSKARYEEFSKKYDLIITTDNGTSSDFHSTDIDNLIVTDHHPINENETVGEDILYILNPNLNRTDGLNYSTSGGIVAYDLCMILDDFFAKAIEPFKEYMKNVENVENWKIFKDILRDYASFTIVSDMAILDKQHRKMLKDAFQSVAMKNDIMFLYSKFANKYNQSQLSFNIISPINSLSRLGVLNTINPNTKKTYMEGFVRARSYDEFMEADKFVMDSNKQKKSLVSKAENEIKLDKDLAINLILINNSDYKIGLGGLIANNLYRKTKKPTIVGIVNSQKNKISFSGRGDNVKSILSLIADNVGGHSQACGGSIDIKNKKQIENLFLNIKSRARDLNQNFKKILLATSNKFEVITNKYLFDIDSAKKLLKDYADNAKGVDYYKEVVVPIYNFKVAGCSLYSGGVWGNITLQDNKSKDEMEIFFSNSEFPKEEIAQNEVLLLSLKSDGKFSIVTTFETIEEFKDNTQTLKEAESVGFVGEYNVNELIAKDNNTKDQEEMFDIPKETTKEQGKELSFNNIKELVTKESYYYLIENSKIDEILKGNIKDTLIVKAVDDIRDLRSDLKIADTPEAYGLVVPQKPLKELDSKTLQEVINVVKLIATLIKNAVENDKHIVLDDKVVSLPFIQKVLNSIEKKGNSNDKQITKDTNSDIEHNSNSLSPRN